MSVTRRRLKYVPAVISCILKFDAEYHVTTYAGFFNVIGVGQPVVKAVLLQSRVWQWMKKG